MDREVYEKIKEYGRQCGRVLAEIAKERFPNARHICPLYRSVLVIEEPRDNTIEFYGYGDPHFCGIDEITWDTMQQLKSRHYLKGHSMGPIMSTQNLEAIAKRIGENTNIRRGEKLADIVKKHQEGDVIALSNSVAVIGVNKDAVTITTYGDPAFFEHDEISWRTIKACRYTWTFYGQRMGPMLTPDEYWS